MVEARMYADDMYICVRVQVINARGTKKNIIEEEAR
jgi:hypothetical protein